MSAPAFRKPSIKDDLRRLLQSVAGKPTDVKLSSSQYEAVREICASTDFAAREPEALLLEFNACLIEAADEAHIPPGPERTELLRRFMIVFVEELAVSRHSIPSRTPGLSDARP